MPPSMLKSVGEGRDGPVNESGRKAVGGLGEEPLRRARVLPPQAGLRGTMMRLIQDQALSVIRERDRRRLRAMAGVLALGCVLVSGVLGYVWLQVHRVRVSYELDDLRSLRADVEQQNRKLRLELLSLRSYARVDSAARQLGLRDPAPDQIRLARELVTREPDAAETAMVHAARIDGAEPSPVRPEAILRR